MLQQLQNLDFVLYSSVIEFHINFVTHLLFG